MLQLRLQHSVPDKSSTTYNPCTPDASPSVRVKDATQRINLAQKKSASVSYEKKVRECSQPQWLPLSLSLFFMWAQLGSNQRPPDYE